MKNILVRRGVYPRTISPEPGKGLGSPTDNYVRTADAIELKSLSEFQIVSTIAFCFQKCFD